MFYPIILCGGSGTRLWPVSRKSYPKQFSKIVGDKTLFQETCARFKSENFSALTIVTNDRFRFTVLDELSDIGIHDIDVVLEPSPRNTAPAVLAGALHVASKDPEATILILPADHSIVDLNTFIRAIETAGEHMKQNEIVTFGIKPSHPETGYGYLEVDGESVELEKLQKLRKFVEKPDLGTANEMLKAGNFLWNGGIFLVKCSHLIDQYKTHQSEIWESVSQAMENSSVDQGFIRPDETIWAHSPDVSIDYAIMEKSPNLAVLPVDMGWSDLGDWKSVWEASEKDENGVAFSGSAYSVDCKNTLLRSEKENLVVVGVNLEDIFAVAMNDAVVVGKLDSAQDVKKIVKMLKDNGEKQADEFPLDHRPWGWYETLVLGKRFQVKRIVVKPGAALSLQSHVHRSEHWTVVEGCARVTVDDEVKLLGENMSVYIPLGAIHRMENPGRIPLTLIEVQSGSYLGEDDITRYEDQFGRS